MPKRLLLSVANVPEGHRPHDASPAFAAYPGAHATHETLDVDPARPFVDLPAAQLWHWPQFTWHTYASKETAAAHWAYCPAEHEVPQV